MNKEVLCRAIACFENADLTGNYHSQKQKRIFGSNLFRAITPLVLQYSNYSIKFTTTPHKLKS